MDPLRREQQEFWPRMAKKCCADLKCDERDPKCFYMKAQCKNLRHPEVRAQADKLYTDCCDYQCNDWGSNECKRCRYS